MTSSPVPPIQSLGALADTTEQPDAEGSVLDARQAKDEILIEALASGMTYAEAGKTAGLTSRTVSRRLEDPEFSVRVSRRRGDRVAQVTGALTAMSTEALQVLRECMADGRPADRLRAAQLTLVLMSRFRHDTEIEDRLAALEQQLQEGGDR
jgi:hypothetical protein